MLLSGFLSFKHRSTIMDMTGIRKEIKNQNQNLRPWLLASKPAIIWGPRITPKAIKNKGISNIKRTILKFKKLTSCVEEIISSLQSLTNWFSLPQGD
jgi:hypothetical protein